MMFLAALLTATSAGPAERALLPGITYTLPSNGLRVILSPDPSLPLVAVNVWYQVGSAHERPGETGLAHLFEHLMFQGSRHVPAGKHYQVLRSIGAVDTNGTSSLDRTNFFATVPSHQLETLLWLESDRMGFLELTDEGFRRQQAAAIAERRGRQNAAPYGPSNERVFQSLFPVGHPYHSYLLGSQADIESLTLDRARNFYRRHFVPANASVAIVGDFDPLTMKTLIDRWFGSLPNGAAPTRRDVVTVPITSGIDVRVIEPVERPRVQVAWHSPKLLTPLDAVAEVYAELITRRSDTLVAQQRSLQHVSVFTVTEFSDTPAGIDTFLRTTVFTPDEVASAARAIRLRMLQALQNIGYRADRLNHYARFAGDAGFANEDLARYSVTVEDIERFAATLTQNRRVVVRTVPAP
ncbi:MAG: pitrilysin family protein [Myxococcota bacterium]